MQIRNQKDLSQRELSQRSGIAASYLSRIENRHLEPRPKTLRKIAQVLGVPLAEFFQDHDEKLTGIRCAITASGRCVMDMTRASRGKSAQSGAEAYTPRHLRLLRLAGYLIQSGDARLLDALEVVLEALLNSDRSLAARLPLVVPQPMSRPSRQPG
jgi:transcriptional regulator with XRE-family HTH domain